MNSEEVLSSGNAIFYQPKKFAVYINCDKSYCNKLHQKSELFQGLKESKLWSKKLQKTQQSQQSSQKDLQEYCTEATKRECLATVIGNHYWQNLMKQNLVNFTFRENKQTNTFRDLNQYCNLNFTRHYVYAKNGRLMRAYFYCNIEEYQLHGTCELFSDKKMSINFKVNQIKQAKGKVKSFQSR